MTAATACTLLVRGDVRGKGRARVQRATGRMYTPDKTKVGEARVREAWRDAGEPDLGDGPVALVMRVAVDRPAGHFRRDGSLSAAGLRLPRPVGVPDLDNVLKLVGDGLNKLAYKDDSRIVDATLAREWAVDGEGEHLLVMLRCVGLRVPRPGERP